MNEENRINEEVIQEPYVPSPKWKRVMAWILFGIVCLGIIIWLISIAYPTWTDSVKAWLGEKH